VSEESVKTFILLATATLGELVPMFLLWLLGIFLAVRRWRLHPGVSRVAVAAFLLPILDILVGLGEILWLVLDHERRFGPFLLPSRLLHGTLHTFSWALVIIAVFGWRSHPGAVFAHVDERHDFAGDRR
jgi:hypothetical protein